MTGAQAQLNSRDDLSETAERNLRFREFVATHRERAVAMAWRLCGGDQALAEDIAQEAFVQAWRGLDRFRGDAQLSTWFYRILIRQAGRQRRKQRWRDRWQGLTGQEPARPVVTGDEGLQRRIGTALETLSAGQREAFVLVHLEGYTVTDAADLLGRAPGTIKSHLHRALTALRAQLADLKEEA